MQELGYKPRSKKPGKLCYGTRRSLSHWEIEVPKSDWSHHYQWFSLLATNTRLNLQVENNQSLLSHQGQAGCRDSTGMAHGPLGCGLRRTLKDIFLHTAMAMKMYKSPTNV